MKRRILILAAALLLCSCAGGTPEREEADASETRIETEKPETVPVSGGESGEEETAPMKISISDGTHTVVYQLNDSGPAKSLYAMLPIECPVENYGSNEKIFYPESEVDPSGGIEGGGEAGGLALFSPWGNVVMYYGSFSAYPGLYLLGEAVLGAEQVKDLAGTIRAEAEE